MDTVEAYTAERMKQIRDSTVVNGQLVGNNLILTKHDGSTINTGNAIGPKGDKGPFVGITSLQLDTATDPSVQAGNDIVNGSDGKLFFNHAKAYFHNVPVFSTNATRDTNIPSPSEGQACYISGTEQFLIYRTAYGWRPPFGSPWGNLFTAAVATNKAQTPAQNTVEFDVALRAALTNYPANRILKATFNLLMYTNSGTPGYSCDLQNILNTSEVYFGHSVNIVGSSGHIFSTSMVLPSRAGSSTYTPRITVTGSGSLQLGSGAPYTSRFTLEDIGPATSVVNP